MSELILAIAVFTAFHALPSTPLRQRLIDLLGRQMFLWSFSTASVLLFAWVWIAYRSTVPDTVFWVSGPLLRWLSALLMLAAFVLAGLAIANQPRVLLTGEVALASADPVRGVLRISRHPLLWAIALWGIVHILNNADPPSWVFFGYVTALALAGTWLIDRRRSRLLGANWQAIRTQTSNVPFAAVLAGRNRMAWHELSPVAALAAAALWGLALFVHPLVFGMPAVWL